MGRRKANRDPQRLAGGPSKSGGTAIPWWPVACFAVGLGAAFVVRSYLPGPRRLAEPTSATTGPDRTVAEPTPPSPAKTVSRPEPRAARSLPQPVPDPKNLTPTERRFAEQLRQGYDHFQRGRYAEALEALSRASKIDPTVPDSYHYMGEVYQKLLLVDEAEQSYRQALAVRPSYSPSAKSLAMLLYEAGRYEEAVALLEDLRSRRPNDSFVLAELAINATALGDPEKAIALLEQYNAIEGKQAWGYTHLGRAHADAGNTDQAEEAYRQALAIAPTFPLAHYWLGQLLVATGRKEESKKPLAEYRRLRKLEDEAHQLNMALARNPDDVNALVAMARVRYLLGDSAQSLAMLERARRVAPHDQKLLNLYRQVSEKVKSSGPGR